MFTVEVQELIVDHLALAHVEKIKEGGNRFRIVGAGASADYNGVPVSAVSGTKRNLRKFKHLQNIGVAHLVLQRDAEKITLLDRTLTFECKERYLLFAQNAIQIGPRRENTLTIHILATIEHAV